MRPYMTVRQADILEYYLRAKPFVKSVKVYDMTGDAVICYSGKKRCPTNCAYCYWCRN
jgi:hypothetical protein